jgi:eukaryotic-like serine/threonine-protein kinase
MNSSTNQYRDPPDAHPDDDPRVLRATQEYLAAVEAGRRPDRAEFLARHPDLVAELTTYLDAVDMLHPLPIVAPPPKPAAGPDEPTPLGDFRIVREIGRGGMGVVHEAVQLSLGRRVALKVLPFAAALDAKQLQRFKNEAQAAAQLHHTNIVPVYAVGVERGVHYYAMQLIEGQNLSDLIQQMRRDGRPEVTRIDPATDDGQSPSPPAPLPSAAKRPAPTTLANNAGPLTTRRATRSSGFYQTAVRLVAQAADALEHAHQLGVIHRDVKPANLMVDGRGNLWVTDFGLAQFHNCAGLTRTGDLMGTLRYMSPEQAGGQNAAVDARTDVYSLGATLYELLTLEPLFDGDDYQTVLRNILHDEPRPPRALDRSVPEELETIVLKAVSKSAADRYPTAQEFADDLNRFLNNLPIKARRPTAVQRLRKWSQRHPSAVVASGAVLVLVSLVSLVSILLILAAMANTDAAYKSEQKRADEAEARLRLAQQAVDELRRVSEDELAGKPGTERLRKRLLESVLAYYQEFIDLRSNDPQAQAELRETKKQVDQIVADLAVLEANGRLDLLSQPAVLDDLALSDKQREQVKELTARLEKQRREWFGFGRGPLPPDDARKRSLEQARANDADAGKILGLEQLARLPQIALQQQGTGAFREPDVAAALKLTPDQREHIRKIDEETFFAVMQEWRRVWGPPEGGRGRPEDLRKPEDIRKGEETRKANEQKLKATALDNIQALLTAEQKHLWKEMTGETFKGPAPFFPGFVPGGGPGGPKPPPPGDGPNRPPPGEGPH